MCYLLQFRSLLRLTANVRKCSTKVLKCQRYIFRKISSNQFVAHCLFLTHQPDLLFTYTVGLECLNHTDQPSSFKFAVILVLEMNEVMEIVFSNFNVVVKNLSAKLNCVGYQGVAKTTVQ